MFLTIDSTIKDDMGNLYILDEIIGQGGFGYVFKAHRIKDNSIFAIKTILPSFGNNATLLAFKNEIQSATKVSGKNIIHYEYIHDGETFSDFPPYIIMEYADGGTLSDLIEERKRSGAIYSNNELTHIFRQLAQGMKEINLNLIHRDIKPDNILICGNTLKISDFGLSKIAAENTRTMSFKGGGTFLYMAPEAWDFTKNTIQMDMYSMGIVFYELATLQYPYSPYPHTLEECKSRHLYSPFISPSKANPNLSPSLASLIGRMLEKSVKKRFSTWDDILDLLNAQTTTNSYLDELVELSLAAKNTEDIKFQEQEATLKREKKTKEDFLQLVQSQFQQTIIAPIVEFSEKINGQYAGENKLTFKGNQYTTSPQSTVSWKLNIPPNNSITINFETILKENFIREVYIDRFFNEIGTRKENYIPQYNGKNILGWGEIVNKAGYGFNILLLESDDIYGDWIIMSNMNNLASLTNKDRPEPFAFSLKELVSEINNIQAIHLYRSDLNDFTEKEFLKLIQKLSFELI